MSHSRRFAALAVLGALVGLPLAATPASAQDSGAQVTFKGGGLGLLLCGSQPDVPQINVGAESKVRLTNGLGLNATLKIDGAASATLANGETVEVQFHRGPVAIGMEPDCALNLNQDFQQLTVEVAPVAPAPARTSAAPKPANKPPAANQPPNTGAPTPGPDASEDPLLSDLSEFPGGSAAPVAEGPFSSPATVVNPDGSPAQRFASETGPMDKGPIGLLAIIATVCVVGVSAGAIRAIITQRATRAEFA